MINLTPDESPDSLPEIDNLRPSDIKIILKNGFLTHGVFDPKASTPGMVNHHTHGMPHTLKHKDFQIVIPLHPQTSHEIFTEIYNLIKKG